MSRTLDNLISNINKKHGGGMVHPIATRGDDVPEITHIPSQSHAINYLLGGGWYQGKMHEFFGGEHAGKTTLTLVALVDCLRHVEYRKPVVFVDVEHRFNRAWAEKFELEVDKDLILIQPPSAEVATDIMNDFIVSGEIAAMAYDSVGGSTTSALNTSFDKKEFNFGGAAQVISRQVNQLAPLLNLYDVPMFYINQLREDMDGYNRPVTPGGRALKHRLSARIYLRRGNKTEEKFMAKSTDGPVQVGYAMLFRLIKGFGPTPRDQWSDFYFEPSELFDKVGFDTAKELQRLGISTGVIVQKSSWYYYGDVKGNGRDNFFEEVEKAGVVDKLASDIMASLGSRVGLDEVELDDDLKMPTTDGVDIKDPEV